jgi:hypothetical protein
MENREFAAYGYQVDGSLGKLTGIAVGTAFMSWPLSGIFSAWCLLLLVVPLCIFIYVKRSGCNKPLLIGSRYLIVGDRIVYYQNITQARLDEEKQTLTISSDRCKNLIIAADKFPTNARKTDKIKANKTAKFEKVTGRILDRLRVAAPEILVS